MDAAFVQQNQIIERYLMGKLPIKGARDFERWCQEHPDAVAQLGLSDRINSALRLLDAAGEPLPWTEKPLAFWQKLPLVAGVAAVAAVALVMAIALFAADHKKAGEIAELERKLVEQPLQPVQATRPITVELERGGPPGRSQITVGDGRAELADFKFDVAWSQYTNFVVTIDRVNQGRVAVLTNVARDSNGHVRIALNSTALGPGEYAVEIEGLDLRRGRQAQGWSRFRITR
jgi:hypothetical protein